jgi:hypothetical protein
MDSVKEMGGSVVIRGITCKSGICLDGMKKTKKNLHYKVSGPI